MSTIKNEVEETKEENYLETLFADHVPSESDKVDFDWGEPKGHEIL